MGIEYTIRINAPNQVAVEAELMRIAGASVVAGSPGEIDYRRGAGTMPDATARAEGTAVYFCDHGGFGREVLGHVVARLVDAFGPVQVEDRE